MDVNVERAEDVLTHQRLLKLAEDPATRPVFEVRCVQVIEKHLSFLSLSLIRFFDTELFGLLNWFVLVFITGFSITQWALC